MATQPTISSPSRSTPVTCESGDDMASASPRAIEAARKTTAIARLMRPRRNSSRS